MSEQLILMTNTLSELCKDKSDQFKGDVLKALIEIRDSYEQSVAHAFNLSIEDEIEGLRGATYSCKRGCSHCCKINVDITEHEALMLVDVADERSIPLHFEKLTKQASTPYEEYIHLPVEERTCVFLKDEACSIYEYRPAACRKHYVQSPAEDCSGETNPTGKIARIAKNHKDMKRCEPHNAGLVGRYLVYPPKELFPATILVWNTQEGNACSLKNFQGKG